MEKELIVTDVVVIGAGPAGMTAALYASRANLKTHMIEKGVPGGEVNNTADVENYPGFSLVSGPELAQHMYQGAMRFDAVHDYGDVSHIEVEGDLKRVHTSSKVYEAKAVIVATGSFHRHLGVPGEEELVEACPTVRSVTVSSSAIRKLSWSAGVTQLLKKPIT